MSRFPGILMEIAVLLAALTGFYGFVGGLALGILVSKTGIVEKVITALGPTVILVLGISIVILATFGIVSEASDAVTILRQNYEDSVLIMEEPTDD